MRIIGTCLIVLESDQECKTLINLLQGIRQHKTIASIDSVSGAIVVQYTDKPKQALDIEVST